MVNVKISSVIKFDIWCRMLDEDAHWTPIHNMQILTYWLIAVLSINYA
jgi:hypothetical protein